MVLDTQIKECAISWTWQDKMAAVKRILLLTPVSSYGIVSVDSLTYGPRTLKYWSARLFHSIKLIWKNNVSVVRKGSIRRKVHNNYFKSINQIYKIISDAKKLTMIKSQLTILFLDIKTHKNRWWRRPAPCCNSFSLVRNIRNYFVYHTLSNTSPTTCCPIEQQENVTIFE